MVGVGLNQHFFGQGLSLQFIKAKLDAVQSRFNKNVRHASEDAVMGKQLLPLGELDSADIPIRVSYNGCSNDIVLRLQSMMHGKFSKHKELAIKYTEMKWLERMRCTTGSWLAIRRTALSGGTNNDSSVAPEKETEAGIASSQCGKLIEAIHSLFHANVAHAGRETDYLKHLLADQKESGCIAEEEYKDKVNEIEDRYDELIAHHMQQRDDQLEKANKHCN